MKDNINNTEIQENIDNQVHSCSAYNAMEQDIEDCSEYMDNHCIDYKDIQKFEKNSSSIVSLANAGAFPEVAVDWTIQMLKISKRFNSSNYIELYNSQKELTLEEYCDLESAVNKGTAGNTMKEILILTGKDEETIIDILFSQCYLTVADHNPIMLLMGDELDIYLIPLVNRKNQLTGKFRMKYLFTTSAVSCLAENKEYYDMFKT